MKFIITLALSTLLVMPLAAEDIFTLDDALNNSINYLSVQIPQDKTVLLFNIECNNRDISDYIINELTSAIVNNDHFTLVDRKNMEALETELNFQLSGMVSDETSISVGRMTGAEIVISGSFTNMGKSYKLYIQASSVETSQILASKIYTVKKDKKLTALLKSAKLRPPKPVRPKHTPGPDDWKNKWLYLGARSGISTNFYKLNTNIDVKPEASANIDAALQMLFCFTGNFALQTEAVILQDKVTAKNQNISVTVNAVSLMIPVFARLTYTANNFLAAIFGGAYFTAPLGQMTVTRNSSSKSYGYDNPAGLLFGTELGLKLGQGVIFGDMRLGGDMDFVKADNAGQYQRSRLFSISIGYRIGFFNK
jgi:hypothetical protein